MQGSGYLLREFLCRTWILAGSGLPIDAGSTLNSGAAGELSIFQDLRDGDTELAQEFMHLPLGHTFSIPRNKISPVPSYGHPE